MRGSIVCTLGCHKKTLGSLKQAVNARVRGYATQQHQSPTTPTDMQDLNHRIDAQPDVRRGYAADRQEQRRRRTEGDTDARRTIKLKHATDMGRLAEVLSQDELRTLIKADQEMRQIRVRNRLSGQVPPAFWDAYDTAVALRHTALKRIRPSYAYEAPENNV